MKGPVRSICKTAGRGHNSSLTELGSTDHRIPGLDHDTLQGDLPRSPFDSNCDRICLCSPPSRAAIRKPWLRPTSRARATITTYAA